MNAETLLRDLVETAKQFRRTAIVDDEFPFLRDRFDSMVERANQYLQRTERNATDDKQN